MSHYKEKSLSLVSNLSTVSSLHLWFARVGETTQIIESQIESILSPSEKSRLQATHSKSKQREYLLSRALMRHALQQHFPSEKSSFQFIEQPHSTPVINNLPSNNFISLSHSKGMICFALADSPVGVDLEMKRQRNFAEMAKIFMSKKELTVFLNSTNDLEDEFYMIWSAKEAYYKAQPSQIQMNLNFTDISISNLRAKEKPSTLLEWNNTRFALAVVLEQQPKHIQYHSFLDSVSLDIMQQLMTHQQ